MPALQDPEETHAPFCRNSPVEQAGQFVLLVAQYRQFASHGSQVWFAALPN